MEKMQVEGTLEGHNEYVKHMDLIAADEANFKFDQLVEAPTDQNSDEELEGGELDLDEGE